jgi:hypothetical protein
MLKRLSVRTLVALTALAAIAQPAAAHASVIWGT